MTEINSILKAIKEHGVIAVILVAMFVYFQAQINSLTDKYDDCMNERVNDAYRLQLKAFNGATDRHEKHDKIYAILPHEIKVKNDRFKKTHSKG